MPFTPMALRVNVDNVLDLDQRGHIERAARIGPEGVLAHILREPALVARTLISACGP